MTESRKLTIEQRLTLAEAALQSIAVHMAGGVKMTPEQRIEVLERQLRELVQVIERNRGE